MPLPVIVPSGVTGGQFRTGRTGSFSFRCDFEITNTPPTWNSVTAPDQVGGGTTGSYVYDTKALVLPGDSLGIFQGLTVLYEGVRGINDRPEDTRYGYQAWYGAHITDPFDSGYVRSAMFLEDDTVTDPHLQHYYTITGSVRISLDYWEEWKNVLPVNGFHAFNEDILTYSLKTRSSSNWTVDVQINNPYATPDHAAFNTKHFAGNLRRFGFDTLIDCSDWKHSLLNIALAVAPAQPGGHTKITGLSFEDGTGTGYSYTNTVGDGTLTIADHTLLIQRSGYSTLASALMDLWPYTPVTVDGLVTKCHNANFSSDVTLLSSLPGHGGFTAPNGVWAETIDCTRRQISQNGALVVDQPGQKQLVVRLDDAWSVANGINDGGSSADNTGITLCDDICWAATTFAHAASVSLDTFSSVSGWSGTGVTVTSAAGLHLVASSGGRSVSKSYDRDLRNFRYFRISGLVCDSGTVGQPIVFVLGGKNFTIKPSSTSATDYDIDLMAPDPVVSSAAVLVDKTSSAWELQGNIAGVEQVGSIGITLPNSTSVVTIASLSVVRHGATLPGWIVPEQAPAGNVYEFYHSDGLPVSNWTYLRARFLGAVVDGKPCADLYYALRTSATADIYKYVNGITTGGGTNYERLSMNDLLQEINSSRQLGLSATTIAEYPSTAVGSTINYYKGTLPADFLTLDSPGSRAAWGVDLKSKTLNAWPQYGQVNIYPGYVGGYTLRFTKRVWGVAMGTVVSPTPAGQKVVVSSPLGPDQTLTTDANGFYRSAPRATRNISQFVAHRTASALRRVIDGMYSWTGFYSPAVAPPYLSPSNTHHPTWGYYGRVWTESGNVFFSGSHYGAPIGGFDVHNIQVTGSGQDRNPRIVYDKSGAQRLLLVFARVTGSGSNVYQAFSTDEGRTWREPVVVISGGMHPAIAVGQDGTILVAAYVGTVGGTGKIACTVQALGDAAPSAPFYLKDRDGNDLTVNDDTFAVSQARDGALRWVWALVIAGDTGISEWFSTQWDSRTLRRVS